MSRLADKPYLVLVADDSEADRLLLRSALSKAPRLRILAEVADGAEVITYLKRLAGKRDRDQFPDLLLLDLKMPLRDGFAVLEWLKARMFKKLTVVVLTDSMQPEHIKKALDLGADLFQVKPRTTHDRELMARALQDYLEGRTSSARRDAPSTALHPTAQTGAY